MTFCVEKDVEDSFEFSLEEIGAKVCEKALELEKFPYEAEINILLTDEHGIREYNFDHRQIDAPTDVLSFPNLDYRAVADYSMVEESWSDYCNPDTDEVYLGDIILCYERIELQARTYGHSVLRECAFLIAHSMLHLLGYDHMNDDDERDMIERQENILGELGIVR